MLTTLTQETPELWESGYPVRVYLNRNKEQARYKEWWLVPDSEGDRKLCTCEFDMGSTVAMVMICTL